MATQTLTVDGDGGVTSGWRAEGGDYTRLQSDDGDTTRLYTPTTNDTASFTISNTVSVGTVNSLTIYAKVRNLNPIDALGQLGVRIAGVNYFSSDIVNNGTSYVLVSYTLNNNPATSAAWTASQIDSTEIVIKKTDSVGTAVTYMYVILDYNLLPSYPGNIGRHFTVGSGMSRSEVAN